MGMRVVIMLNCDRIHEWSKDPDLGSKIHQSMNLFSFGRDDHCDGLNRYGHVVEVTHADNATLAVLDHYTGFSPVGHSGYWSHKNDDAARDLRLLTQMAEKMGYSLRKKPVKAGTVDPRDALISADDVTER